jgi:cytochrome d ubiquinol oxidase subunit I
MQHPTGYVMNANRGRAELTDIVQVLTQKTALSAFFHVVPSAFLASGAFFAGIGAWLVLKKKDVEVAQPAVKLGAITIIVSFLLVAASGDFSARVMTQQQPMKMAAAEGLYDSKANAPFSLFTLGSLDGSHAVFQVGIPSLLSLMSTGKTAGVVEGVNDLEKQYDTKYGNDSYTPVIWLAYWSFRLMIGFGALALLLAGFILWRMRKGGLPTSKWFNRAAITMPFLPLIGISFGWIFTESARQPWVVFGLMKTKDGVSTVVSTGEVAFTMIAFTLLYGVLAVIEFGLMLKTIKQGPQPAVEGSNANDGQQLTMAY